MMRKKVRSVLGRWKEFSVILTQLFKIVLKPSAHLHLAQDPSDFFKTTVCPTKYCLLSQLVSQEVAQHSYQFAQTFQLPLVQYHDTGALFPCCFPHQFVHMYVHSAPSSIKPLIYFSQLSLHSSKLQPFQSAGIALSAPGPDLTNMDRLALGWAGYMPVKQK